MGRIKLKINTEKENNKRIVKIYRLFLLLIFKPDFEWHHELVIRSTHVLIALTLKLKGKYIISRKKIVEKERSTLKIKKEKRMKRNGEIIIAEVDY